MSRSDEILSRRGGTATFINAGLAGVPSSNWRRVAASGALWAMVYNLVWAVAWFAFMRREWQIAFAAIGTSSEVWIAEIWVVWGALTLPMGLAIMAYAASDGRPAVKTSVRAALATCLLMTFGMAGWGIQESLSIRVIAADAAVNLVGMVAGSLAGAWNLRAAQ